MWAKNPIQPPAPTCTPAASPAPVKATAPSPPSSGTPPLLIHSGTVAGTVATPGEITITPIYWVPSGGPFTIPAAYSNLVNQYVADVAADNGTKSNMFSVVQQYTNASNTNLTYKVHAGLPLTDSAALPTT